MEEGRSAFKILAFKPTGKRPLGPRHRCEDNIRTDLQEIDINMKNIVDSLRIGITGGPCECSFEPPDSVSHGIRVTGINIILIYTNTIHYFKNPTVKQ